jgi:chemotaxis response regulator CheB
MFVRLWDKVQPMGSTEAPIRAGLIFQQRQSAEQLKRTLREAGIDLAVELDVDALRAGQLDQLEVEVYIVNLESELEDLLDEVTEMLEATDRPVVYNDAGVSSDLSGWDQARWARHLAAKIRKGRDLLPPAPAGAQAIPMPTRAEAAPAEPGSKASLPAEPEAVLSGGALAGETAAFAAEPVEVEEEPTQSGRVESELEESLELEQVAERGDGDAGALEALELGELDLDLPEVPAAWAGSSDTNVAHAGSPQALVLGELDFELTGEAIVEDVNEDLAAVSIEASSQLAGAPVSTTDEASPGDWSIDPEPAADEMTIAAEATNSTDATSAGLELTGLDDDLELGLDLPQELYQEEQLEAIGGDADQAMASLDAGGLDDLSAFDVMDDGATDLLDVLDEPAGSTSESFEADDLDALFNDDLSAIDEPELIVAEDLQGSVAEVAVDELEALAIFDELPQVTTGESDRTAERFVGLDDLLADGNSGSRDAELDKGKAEAPASAGFSLPDLSEWVLEPLEEEPEAANKEALPSFKPESMGLDLRDLDSGKPRIPLAEGSAEAAGRARFEAPVAPAESLDDDLADLDLDLGIDFVDLDLAPEPESSPPATHSAVMSEPVPAAVSATSVGPKRIVILGASIGGPDSIRAFLKDIKPDLKAAFVLVQHMGAEFLDLMAQQLDRVSPLRVHLASHGRALSEGEVLIAPVGKRLKIDDKGAVNLAEEAGATAYSPSIDQVLTDSLQRFGADRLLVIIFSGMANDAVAGSRQLAAAGVPIWAQDPASCVISSMVDGVVAAKVVSFIGTPEQLAAQANRLLA